MNERTTLYAEWVLIDNGLNHPVASFNKKSEACRYLAAFHLLTSVRVTLTHRSKLPTYVKKI